MKILKEYRLRKLKTALNNIRTSILKKDFTERSKEIAALEQSVDRDDWTDSYKKLKIKLLGQKLIESPVKPVVKYYFESAGGSPQQQQHLNSSPTKAVIV